MLKWNVLSNNLEKMSRQHQQLTSQFIKFAKFSEDQVTLQEFNIKGIRTSLNSEEGYFTISFCQQTLYFVFSSISGSVLVENNMLGNVSCYLERKFSEQKYIKIGGFTYNGKGETNLTEPTNCDAISISHEFHAAYLICHFIHESLSDKWIEPIHNNAINNGAE